VPEIHIEPLKRELDGHEPELHPATLAEHVERARDAYRAIVFAPYLYGPTLLGVERAGIQPQGIDRRFARRAKRLKGVRVTAL